MKSGGPVRRRPGRPPKAEAGDTKAALVEAALRLFAQKGYTGTSIRAIAREVGLSESVLYAHFTSKQDIFDAAVATLGPQGLVSGRESLDPGLVDDDPAAYLRALVEHVLDAWDSPSGRLFISLMVRDGLVHSVAMGDTIARSMGEMAPLFQHWVDTGRIPPDLGRPADLAWALFGPIGQARLLWLHADAAPEERQEARGRALRHTELFIRAVFREQRKSPDG
ncbi:TetR/AcrR family transcriptional regulator [Actinomadura sp. KC345]|uniref:TetR/AcrR family transcriptional regulator n=1 Tax=Actinomadura sp. KC345 TaxID=2530371 RepID=UPI0010523BDD|nr:TetR/AcrR family transcriptional regulator [Actinomadura sp. KC345]TDC58214.1 TetR/AcrR family transcriptional regulator [Actinomadura sp. KC345]